MTEFASFLIPSQENYKEKNNGALVQSLNFNEPETPIAIFDNVKRQCDDTMRIFLRLRPASDANKGECYDTPNSYDVIAKPPTDSANYRNFIHGYGKTSQKFTFSKLFDGLTNQEAIFNETSKPLLNEFAKGGDRLLFTYGTTSSGKTYTMNGQKQNFGIVPRSLIALYNSVQLSNDPSIMPVDFSEVSHLTANDVQRILREKATLLKLSEKESSDIVQSLNDKKIHDDPLSYVNNDYKTTFWITFTEIYNEMIFDLLDVTQCQTNGNNKQAKRPILDIRTARNGGSYVKGLACYPAYSAEEAYRLMLVGRRSQKIGATRLNQNSSRSHTIFTIRAVRTNASSQYLTQVSNFSFCDLAGSERTTKAQTTGLSQKEACNINSSLLALGRCIEILRRNQNNPGNLNLVPFRDSKLTRIFQTYLTGNGTASMIVCVNPDPQLFDESLQVLKFSALAREVVLQEKAKPAVPNFLRKSHFCRLGLNTPTKKSARLTWDSDEELNEEIEATLLDEEEFDDEYTKDELYDIIETLKQEVLAVKREKRAAEAQLRDKLDCEWSKKILQMENDHSDQMQKMRDEMNGQILKVAKKERDNAYLQLKKRKRHCDSSEEEDRSSIKLAAKEKEVTQMAEKLKEAEEECADVRETADILSQELEKMRTVCKQQDYKLSVAQIELQKWKQSVKIEAGVQTEMSRRSDMSDYSIITVEADTSIKSNSSSGSRHNRFSSFSSDMKIRAKNVVEPPPPPASYFGPLQSPDRSGSIPEPETVKKKVHMFEINEEDVNDENEKSFLQYEANFKILELESRLDAQQKELEQKTVALKELTSQYELAKNDVTESMSKLISREKMVMVLNDQQRYIDTNVDTIVKKLGLDGADTTKDVQQKLVMILESVTKSRPKIMAALVENDTEEGMEMDEVPVRVTRSHNCDGKAKRTKRKK